MNNNFSDFIKNNQNTDKEKSNTTQSTANEKQNINENDIQKILNNYQNMSQGELIQKFFELSKEKRKNGELNTYQINMIRDTLFPYLTNEQKMLFENLISQV